MFRVKPRGRATKGERQPSRTAVPPRWWHHIKLLSANVPLSRWAVLVKTTAMTGILLVGLPANIIKSSSQKSHCAYTTCLQDCETKIPSCDINVDAKGSHEALGVAGSNTSGNSKKTEGMDFKTPAFIHTGTPNILTSLSCGGSW